jgi:HEAT repeats
MYAAIGVLMSDFDTLVGEIDGVISAGEPDSFWEARVLFETLVFGQGLAQGINARLRKLLHNSGTLDDGTGTTTLDSLTLYSSPFATLMLTRLRSRSKYLYLHPSHFYLSLVDSPRLSYAKYVVQPEPINSVVSLDHELKLVESGILNPGDVLMRNGLCEVVDYEPIEAAVTFVRLFSANTGSVQWAFERETLRPWGATAADPRSSHLVSITNLAGQLGQTDVIETLASLAVRHDDHFVRWSAVKNLCLVDRSAGLAAVEKAITDPHPHVRTAAVRTLDRYR